MNITTLSQIAQSSRAADIVFRALASRDRSTWNLNLSRFYTDLFKSGAKISRDDFNKVFAQLERAGAGNIIYGTRGVANRFNWNYSLREAANRALLENEAKKKTVVTAPAQVTEKPTVIQIELAVPAGVSQSDIQAWISLASELKAK